MAVINWSGKTVTSGADRARRAAAAQAKATGGRRRVLSRRSSRRPAVDEAPTEAGGRATADARPTAEADDK